jgi:penicillin amidase
MRILRGLVVTLLVLILIGIGVGTWMVRRSFPVVDGEIEVPGLQSPVTVMRDRAGIPHITASNTADLFMAQGYVHAQDRFWQMDTWRHIGAGRLSEMFGSGQVETDIFLRTLGFEHAAQAAYDTMPEETREVLDAYAAGVNAYLAERPGGTALSFEYGVLGIQNRGYRPEPWDPVDSLTWAHVMAWDLRSNLEEEIARTAVASELGEAMAEDLYPPHRTDHPPIVGDHLTAQRTGPTLPAAAHEALARAASNASVVGPLGGPFEGIGSNSWVVAGSRTATGAPILADDPHLGIQLPSIWYQATLWCEEVSEDCPFRVTGFTFPGAPGVVIGHNERIAWGVTNEGPDTMDLFVERVDGDRYMVDDEWEEMEIRTETIAVAGGADVDIEVRTTRHGPIISGRFGTVDGIEEDLSPDDSDYEVALAWQALEPATLFQALLQINLASDWEEFREAASLFDIAPQNLVYADVDGHIGYQATGEIPIRRSGDGRYPVPGWTSDHEWTGLVPFEDLPSVLDPPSGMIVTANQPVVGDDYPVFIGVDHDYGYRAKRIGDLLSEAGDDLTVDDMSRIQMDNHDASATFVVPALLDHVDDPALDDLMSVLTAWQASERPYQMDADSPGAAAYAAVWRHLLGSTFEELPEDHAAGGNSRYFEIVRRLLDDPQAAWWDDTGTEEPETRDDILHRAASAAQAELLEALGDDPDSWRWGDLHRADFENQTLGQSGIAPIERLFNRSATPDVSGGSSIVNASGWIASEGYEVASLPSMRMVIDLSDLANSVGVHTTGQSGHVFHRNYFDMNEDWVAGRTRPLPFDPAGFDADATLILDPTG